MPDEVIRAVRSILDRGNTAEIKRRKNGEIIVLEVRRKVKSSAVQQVGCTEGQVGPQAIDIRDSLRPLSFLAQGDAMAATKKTETTKKTNKKASARVLSEKELQTLIDAVPDARRKLAANIVSELVWMSKMMDTLKSKADEIGPLEWFVQGEQSMLRENPALKSYNTTIKNYATLLSKLTDLLPKATTSPPTSDAGDQFDDFVAGRDAD